MEENLCEEDRVVLDGPKQLTIALFVGLALGFIFGYLAKPLYLKWKKKRNTTEVWNNQPV